MGLLFGGRLAMAGNRVILVADNQTVIDAIRENGVLLKDDLGEHSIQAEIAKAEEIKERIDMAILFTKTLSTKKAMKSAMAFISEDTHVLTLQNGIGNLELLEEFLPRKQIMIGVTNFPSDLKGPGRVCSHGKGYTRFMTADGSRPSILYVFCEELIKAGLNGFIREDIRKDIWEKAAFNAALNSITAICRVPCGVLGNVKQGKQLVENIVKETAEVAKAEGVGFSAEEVMNQVRDSYIRHAEHHSSMLQDILKKKKTEADYINGAICERAKKNGLSSPYNETVYAIIKVIESEF